MSLPLRPALLPQCTSCTRRFINAVVRDLGPSRQQVRGKKKLAKAPETITVRLMKDMPTFGRGGTYVPVSIGQMRNNWYPQSIAEYVTHPQLKELKTNNTPMERDYAYRAEDLEKRGKRRRLEQPNDEADEDAADAEIRARQLEEQLRRRQQVEVERISPERSVQLLSILLPQRLDFYRQVNEQTQDARSTLSETETGEANRRDSRPQARQRRGGENAASDLVAARVKALPKAIFGSVSTTDVASAMRAVLAENDEASRVVFGEDDVQFINVKDDAGKVLEETDRVKHVGDYQVEVRIKGADGQPVTRTVRVLAEQAS